MLDNMTSTWVAALTGIGGALLTKGLDWLVAWRQRVKQSREALKKADSSVTLAEIDDSAQMRTELWRRVEEVERRNDELQAKWQEQVEENARCRAAEAGLHRQIEALSTQVAQLQIMVDLQRKPDWRPPQR
jgi:chromosome segregation ATPase